ncbi:MAG: hypothetical protein COW85_04970 [Ignavibacteria bacterium CG22_combo_CG10-13_8_21_14_all_37_15]|nr:MAG: hypothetical protein COW85_04970 [Ignavibacteria bacterium CG22_combo_CG10-13_8_21_14_all_37_15]
MNNLKSFNWNPDKGDYIHYELSLIRLENKEKLLRMFFTVSLAAVSLVVMLTALNLAARV